MPKYNSNKKQNIKKKQSKNLQKSPRDLQVLLLPCHHRRLRVLPRLLRRMARGQARAAGGLGALGGGAAQQLHGGGHDALGWPCEIYVKSMK